MELRARSRFQGQDQVITSHSMCGMEILVPALDIRFEHTSPHMIYATEQSNPNVYHYPAYSMIGFPMTLTEYQWHHPDPNPMSFSSNWLNNASGSFESSKNHTRFCLLISQKMLITFVVKYKCSTWSCASVLKSLTFYQSVPFLLV